MMFLVAMFASEGNNGERMIVVRYALVERDVENEVARAGTPGEDEGTLGENPRLNTVFLLNMM